jgi:hypothetical protein
LADAEFLVKRGIASSASDADAAPNSVVPREPARPSPNDDDDDDGVNMVLEFDSAARRAWANTLLFTIKHNNNNKDKHEIDAFVR